MVTYSTAGMFNPAKFDLSHVTSPPGPLSFPFPRKLGGEGETEIVSHPSPAAREWSDPRGQVLQVQCGYHNYDLVDLK